MPPILGVKKPPTARGDGGLVSAGTRYWQTGLLAGMCGQCVVAEVASVAATLRWYMRQEYEFPLVVASVYEAVFIGNAAHAVAQAAALANCEGHADIAMLQKPSQSLPQTPEPAGPAWGQCTAAAAAAAPAWYVRQPRVLPEVSAAVPTGMPVHEPMQAPIDENCAFAPVQLAISEVQ
jgi:hypothetical protein